MEVWIKDVMNRLDRKKTQILFSEHAAKDKNLSIDDVDNVVKTIQIGKIDEEKSTKEKERICFKNYFDKKQTYFVIVEYYQDFIKIITVIKKKGKY